MLVYLVLARVARAALAGKPGVVLRRDEVAQQGRVTVLQVWAAEAGEALGLVRAGVERAEPALGLVAVVLRVQVAAAEAREPGRVPVLERAEPAQAK